MIVECFGQLWHVFVAYYRLYFYLFFVLFDEFGRFIRHYRRHRCRGPFDLQTF